MVGVERLDGALIMALTRFVFKRVYWWNNKTTHTVDGRNIAQVQYVLIVISPKYLPGFIQRRWCRISSINSTTVTTGDSDSLGQTGHWSHHFQLLQALQAIRALVAEYSGNSGWPCWKWFGYSKDILLKFPWNMFIRSKDVYLDISVSLAIKPFTFNVNGPEESIVYKPITKLIHRWPLMPLMPCWKILTLPTLSCRLL